MALQRGSLVPESGSGDHFPAERKGSPVRSPTRAPRCGARSAPVAVTAHRGKHRRLVVQPGTQWVPFRRGLPIVGRNVRFRAIARRAGVVDMRGFVVSGRLRDVRSDAESEARSATISPRPSRDDAQLLDEAVGVARRVPALEAGLVHPQPAEVVAVGEEPRVDGHATGLGVRVDAGHPSAHAIRVEDVVP